MLSWTTVKVAILINHYAWVFIPIFQISNFVFRDVRLNKYSCNSGCLRILIFPSVTILHMCSSFCILTYTDCNYPNLIFILQWNCFRIIRHGKYKQSKAQIISLILVLHFVSIIGNKQKNLSLNSKLNHWDIMHRFLKKMFYTCNYHHHCLFQNYLYTWWQHRIQWLY